MKLQFEENPGRHAIARHGPGYVEVAGRCYRGALIVTPTQLIEDWLPGGVPDAQAFARIAELKPAIVLLGTGKRLRFPALEATRALIDLQIGLEVMDTAAACRTYNVLLAEGRNVLAALVIED